ncbi:hypothetical protein GLO73106DRAFT_00007160 [Gloeocapsa sp. PCC 73106]|nr:hypothetical protein GLO73106DRAFT_00007160 [Gloeocapsa sp. PCC 73106]
MTKEKNSLKNWSFDDWMNHILFIGTVLLLIYSFVFV